MSATVAADLYKSYFGSPQQPLFVGAKRFPVTEIFADDLANPNGITIQQHQPRMQHQQHHHQQAVLSISGRYCGEAGRLASMTCGGADRSSSAAKLQAELAVHVTRSVGRPGSSVLIFVSGMGEIVDLVDRFEKLNESAGYSSGGSGGAAASGSALLSSTSSTSLSGSGVFYKVVAIHSQIPDEEQEEAFKVESDGRTVKVVVATNALRHRRGQTA